MFFDLKNKNKIENTNVGKSVFCQFSSYDNRWGLAEISQKFTSQFQEPLLPKECNVKCNIGKQGLG